MSAALFSAPVHAQMPENYPALFQTSEAIAQVVWDFGQVFEQDGRWTGRFLTDHLDLDAYVIGALGKLPRGPHEETHRLARSFAQALFEKAATHPSHNIVKSEIAATHQRLYCTALQGSMALKQARLSDDHVELLERLRALKQAKLAEIRGDIRLLQMGLEPRAVEALRALLGDDNPIMTRAMLDRQIAATEAELEPSRIALDDAKALVESVKQDCRALAFWLVDSSPNDPSPLIIYVVEAAGDAVIVNVESTIFDVSSAAMKMTEADANEAAWAARVFDTGRFN